MNRCNMLVVGCGMMGARHVRGLAELERTQPGTVRLCGLCDAREEAAGRLADEAAELLGQRPRTYHSVEEALAALPDLQAADLVTDPRSHDDLAVLLLQAGLHVICEKPLALTVARGRRILQAAAESGRVFATAENNRYDPVNRLARAALAAGLIGTPNFVLQLFILSASNIIATAWRHRRAMGGALLDVAIHAAYITEYLLGPISTVAARARQVQQERSGAEYDGTDVRVAVDSEDTLAAVLEFEAGQAGQPGPTGQFTAHFSSPGETMFKRLIVGSAGTLNLPSDRTGQAIELRRGAETVRGDDLLALLPDHRLGEFEARLFGQRTATYQLPGPEVDRKLIAAEMHDFLQAVATGGHPEADGETGLRSVAIVLAMLEGSLAGRPVSVQEVLDGRLHAYQDLLEAAAL